MRDLYETFAIAPPRNLPEAPEAANLIAGLFHMLGGTMTISEKGERRVIIPEPCSFVLNDRDLPSLPDAKPHERFLNGDEYRGAMKLVTGVLHRLHRNDQTFVYDAFAMVCTPQQVEQAKAARATGPCSGAGSGDGQWLVTQLRGAGNRSPPPCLPKQCRCSPGTSWQPLPSD
jgi:hypothetical protein